MSDTNKVTASIADSWVMEDAGFALLLYTDRDTGTKYKQEHLTLLRRRKIVGLKSWSSQMGEESSIFSLSTSPSGSMEFSTGGRSMMCSDDKMTEVDYKIGEYVQNQKWEYFGTPEAAT